MEAPQQGKDETFLKDFGIYRHQNLIERLAQASL